MNTAFLKSFQCLSEIYNSRAFSSITLNKTLNGAKNSDKALITKIVYGVLDNDIRLEYILGKFVRKMPKGDVLLFLKMGAYCLDQLSIPPYAVVNDLAELAKTTGDKRAVGFVNATLKSVSAGVKSVSYDCGDKLTSLSVEYSYPLWALKKLVKDYGTEVAEKIISARLNTATTIRVTDVGVLKDLDVAPTMFDDAFYVNGRLPSQSEKFTAQSLSSMAIARIAAHNAGAKVLDCCSAPGGKAVYVKQLSPESKVVACDIHSHRVELINSYANRMNVELETHCADMTQFKAEWENMFDTVLCDVPCSGFGVLDARPDIKLFRENKDISDLMKLQQAILENCCRYVKSGGRLIYSTCTVFDNENGQNITKFLKNHSEFTLGKISLPQFPQADGQSFYQFLPHKDGVQGFFAACLVKTE